MLNTIRDGQSGQPVTPAEGFIDKREVARRLKKTVRCLDNWMRDGRVVYYRVGRSVLFKWSEIEAHLAQNYRVCRRNIGK